MRDTVPALLVIVKDVNGNAVPRVSVTFAVVTGGGNVKGGSQTTNASGIAAVGSWTLGTTAGTNGWVTITWSRSRNATSRRKDSPSRRSRTFSMPWATGASTA
jgi:hypothetical protein